MGCEAKVRTKNVRGELGSMQKKDLGVVAKKEKEKQLLGWVEQKKEEIKGDSKPNDG